MLLFFGEKIYIWPGDIGREEEGREPENWTIEISMDSAAAAEEEVFSAAMQEFGKREDTMTVVLPLQSCRGGVSRIRRIKGERKRRRKTFCIRLYQTCI